MPWICTPLRSGCATLGHPCLALWAVNGLSIVYWEANKPNWTLDRQTDRERLPNLLFPRFTKATQSINMSYKIIINCLHGWENAMVPVSTQDMFFVQDYVKQVPSQILRGEQRKSVTKTSSPLTLTYTKCCVKKQQLFILYSTYHLSVFHSNTTEKIPILPEAFLTFASKSCWPLLWSPATI